MAKLKKILVISGLSLAGILLITGAAVLYLYFHPNKLLPYVVKTIEKNTHTVCDIRELTLSSRPWHIRMKGLTFKPDREGRGFDLSIPVMDVDLEFTGPFGQRTLVIQKVLISGPSIKIGRDFSLPQLIGADEKPSYAKRMFDYLFFKEISFQTAKVTNGDLNLAWADQTVQLKDIQMELKPNRLLEFTCGGEVQWLSRGLTLLFPQIYLATDRPLSADPLNTGVHLQIPDATLEGSDLQIAKLIVDAKFQYVPEQKQLGAIDLDLRIEKILFKEFQTANPLNLHLNLRGNFGLKEFALHNSFWAVAIDEMDRKPNQGRAAEITATHNNLLASKGSLEFRLLPETYLSLNILEGAFPAHKLLAALPPNLKKNLKGLTLSGPIAFSGKIQGQKKAAAWEGQCDLNFSLNQNSLTWTGADLNGHARINGTLRVQGPLPAPVLTAKLETSNTQVSGPALKSLDIRPFQAQATLSGAYPLFKISAVELKIPRIKLNRPGKEIAFQEILVLLPKGRIDLTKLQISLPEITIHSSLVAGLKADFLYQNKEITLNLSGSQLDLLKSLQDLKWLPADWRLKGFNDFEMQAHGDQTMKNWSYITRLACREYAFENPSANWVGEKIQAVIESEGEINLDTASLKADWRIRIPEGEILLDAYYFNFKSTPLACVAKLDYAAAHHTATLSATQLELKNLVNLELEGRVTYPGLDGTLDIKIPATALQPLFQQFIREPFKTQNPSLNNLAVSGTFSARMALKKLGPQQSVKGSLQWQNGEALHEGALALKGVNLDWPVWYASGPVKAEKSNLKGALTIHSIKIPGIPEQPLNLNFDVGPNQLTIPSATVLKIKGGSIEFGPLNGKNIYSAAPLIDTSLNLRPLDLRPLLAGFWSKEISGTASGRLNKITFDGRSLTAQGKITAHLFKGEIVLSDIGMDKLMSAHPVFKLSANWANLNMLEMTKDTEFGAIQGVLQGYIKGFEIAAAQPQKFDLLIESIPKKGVTQKMSLRAVDNIARIGGGQSPFVGMAVIYAAFIQELSYKKIGIKASLENDSFRINGTTKEGNTEYLVAKGALLGVNIVNQNPGLPISFKDMLQRIKGVFENSAGPVVK